MRRRERPRMSNRLRKCRELGLERWAVHRRRNAGGKVRWSRRLAHDRNQVDKHELDRVRTLHVRAATETIVLILRRPGRIRLLRLLDVAQLRHQQVGCCPRQEQADNHMSHDVPTECDHWSSAYRSWSQAANRSDQCLPSVVCSAPVVRACAIAVAVTVSAVWRVDGCVDSLTYRTRQSSAHLPDDESRPPCICTIPFQTEPLGPGIPAASPL